MSVKLNQRAFLQAQKLIMAGKIDNGRGNWYQIKPSMAEEIQFLNAHSLDEYSSWFLGINTNIVEETKEKYELPYGDFTIVHKGALLTAEHWANTFGNKEIKSAVDKLLAILLEVRQKKTKK